MKAKLIRVNDNQPDGGFYILRDLNGDPIALEGNLSLKNCQAVERGYDLDELVEEIYPICNLGLNATTSLHTLHQESYKAGFQKALELMGDKKFSEEDILGAIEIGFYLGRNFDDDNPNTDLGWLVDKKENYIQSLQPVEWDVEVVEFTADDLKSINKEWHKLGEPKLDADGCLILKRI